MSNSEPLKYNDYKDTCIGLLTTIIDHCSNGSGLSGSNGSSGSKGSISQSNLSETNLSETDKVAKSSTFLQHNGKVGDLEDLILFLIKSPTTNDIKFKLNKVYKIFNPEARDIILDKTSTIPTSVPSKPVPPVIPVPPVPPKPNS